jgi:hypothetical protein
MVRAKKFEDSLNQAGGVGQEKLQNYSALEE